jgi:hypothetical protein
MPLALNLAWSWDRNWTILQFGTKLTGPTCRLSSIFLMKM